MVFFSADNGGPGQEGWKSPSRWDPYVIERNWPYKGQKHEVWEGGVHVAGWVNGGLVPDAVRGTSHRPLLHVSDWAPTIMNLLTGVDMGAAGKKAFPFHTGCLPLSYSGNPGVNGVSYRGLCQRTNAWARGCSGGAFGWLRHVGLPHRNPW